VNLSTFLFLFALAAAFLGWFALKALAAVAKDTAREMRRQLARRAVDALLFVLLFRWLDKRKPRPAPPAQALPGDDVYAACPLSAWDGDPAACRWCDRPLPARAKRFCCAEHRIEALKNHEFRYARDAALERDEHTCVVEGCGGVATFERALEVDHIEQALGRHGDLSCIHHLTNLRSLCGRHHDEVTAGQRAGGWAS
jgi:hypothetical protein